MARLLIHVEGQTEETFVNEVLCDHLIGQGYEAVGARLMGNARLRRRRAGIRPWPSAKRDILKHLRQDSGCIATTMVDFYGLPQEGDGAWPGRAQATSADVHEKATRVEHALLESVREEMGPAFNPERFIPFVMIHEFEGLLFSDCTAFGRGIGREDLEPQLRQIREGFSTPEHIDDSPLTAPSKRVEGLVSGYQKPLHGTLAALEIGLARIRAECNHFHRWMLTLESLA